MIPRQLPAFACALALFTASCSQNESQAKSTPTAQRDPIGSTNGASTKDSRKDATQPSQSPQPITPPVEPTSAPYQPASPEKDSTSAPTPAPMPPTAEDLRSLPPEQLTAAATEMVRKINLAFGGISDDVGAKAAATQLASRADQLAAVKEQLDAANFDWSTLKSAVADMRVKISVDTTIGPSIEPTLNRLDQLVR